MCLRLGLIGFGTVGQAVARRVVGDHADRLRLARVCLRPGRERPSWLPPDVECVNRFDALMSADIDVVVELVGGLEPAGSWVRHALVAGKSVVSANKQLIAGAGADLLSLAAGCGCALRFEAAVAGGVPVIRAIQDGLAGDRLVSVSGILNGTCNYILSRMECGGLSFDDGLTEAQARGYAEADATADIEGLDARAKLAILAGVALGARVRPEDIPCVSLRTVTRSDLDRARASGFTIRQVSSVERCDGPAPAVLARVGPVLVPCDSPFGRATGCENVIVVRGQYGGVTTFSGQGAGGDATAVAVVSDLLAIAAGRDSVPPRAVPRRAQVVTCSAPPVARSIVRQPVTGGTVHVTE